MILCDIHNNSHTLLYKSVEQQTQYTYTNMAMLSMSSQTSLPLYEKISCKSTLRRCLDTTILLLLLTLVAYRLLLLRDHGLPWLLALLCELWFTFNWILIVSTKWNPVEYKPYPERLSKEVHELPPVDMFVTTADSVLEPPIITINTVLSLLAADYPSHKLACYVSDDGCSLLTFYSLLEASKFAKIWVPFCKKYHVQVRAPFRYFSSKSTTPSIHSSLEFQKEWKKMKEEYEQLNRRIEDASQKSVPCDLIGAFSVFSNIDRRNHPSIIKVIWENKESGPSDAMPSLVYISREKRPEHPHKYKAGAMNVLTRVSGLMTNAPFILNVDCDMFMNNPRVFNSAMCLLLGTKNETESAFVMTPQIFYDGPKDDPFGNQLVVLLKYLGRGIVGLQGPFYGGTGCFHRRKVIYGLCPDEQFDGKLDERSLKGFGNSEKFVISAAHALDGMTNWARNLSDAVEAAHEVAGSQYDYGTNFGAKVGWIYGSTTEDVLTGLIIHARGWKSVQIYLDPPAFLGCAPSGGPASMTQQKRWSTGLLEVLLGVHNPIVLSFKGKLEFRQCLSYLWIMLWGPRSIPELCYATLPPYCIITNSHFLPKVQDPAVCIVAALFVIYNLSTLSEYLGSGLSIRAWWNNQRMARVTAMTAWLFGTISVALKILGLSETVFEVTQKEQSSSGDGDGDHENKDVGRFAFDKSPIFVPGATILFINLSAMLVGLLGLRPPPARGEQGSGIGEGICNVWVVLCFWPFLKGLFGKGKFGIPLSTICKSAALSLLFVTLCTTMS